MKKYKFDLTVDSSALLQANSSDYYSKLYGVETAVNNFRVLPGIKNKTKISTNVFAQLTQDSACAFSATNSTLSSVEIDVCALTAQAKVCQFDLESSFLALEMAKGSNSDFTVASFMSFFWESMANKVHEEIETIRWQGDTGSADTLLNKCDGYLKQICTADTGSGVVRPTYTTLTTSNIIAEMGEGLQLAPAQLQMRKSELRFYVSPDVATLYRIATASTNTINNVTNELGMTYLDIPIVECYGLPSNTYVLTRPENLIYAFDGEGDVDSLEIVDFSKTTLDREIGARADFKVGFHIVNAEEIVFYGACVAS